jgi:hypothetical protein
MTAFRVARASDDALVRSLLRDNGMSGWVEITIEREPSFFDGADWLGHEWAAIAEEDNETVGMYTAAVRRAHVDGREERLGYLGGLRVARRHRHRLRHLRAGYDSIRALAPAHGTLPWWFTVIAAGNSSASRLLEAGLPGLPTYRWQGDYLTFVLPASRGRRAGLWRSARRDEGAAIVRLHNRLAARYHCSPVLDAASVERIGFERFLVHERDGQMLGCVALWDQRAFKQVVARRYRGALGVLRPAYNLYARLDRRVPLPPPGGALAQTFLAFLALADEAAPQIEALIRDALSHCRTPAAALGLHARHPWGRVIESFRPLRYAARVYAVSFGAPVELDSRPVQPEAALL